MTGPTIVRQPVTSPARLQELRTYYSRLKPQAAENARAFFAQRAAAHPDQAYMESVFLDSLRASVTGDFAKKVTQAEVTPPNFDDKTAFPDFEELALREVQLTEVGMKVLEAGDLMVIDLAAGDATGFGGTAKAVVEAVFDHETNEFLTYLDLKRLNYLDLQRKAGKHLIAAEMVSDKTHDAVVLDLQKFAARQGLNLVIIESGTSRAEIEQIRDAHKDDWQNTIIVPLAVQPPTLQIQKTADESGLLDIGAEYMGGHGQIYNLMQHSLKDVAEVFGAKFFFTNNIDNLGATVSPSILGYFVERVQQDQIEAMMEAAKKAESEKGGVPAVIRGTLGLLEGCIVGDDLKNDFASRDVFPMMNTNTFWFTAGAVFNHDFDLPYVDNSGTASWRKIEQIMGMGMDRLKWITLTVDRGQRFLPAKTLAELWLQRTDFITRVKHSLRQTIVDGAYVSRGLFRLAKSVLGNVGMLNANFAHHGAEDQLTKATSVIIGGEAEFDKTGTYRTMAPVHYQGDVMIIFETPAEGQTVGDITIKSADGSPITLRDSVIFVPVNSELLITENTIDFIDPRAVNPAAVEAGIRKDALWPDAQIRRIMNKFFGKVAPVAPKGQA